MLTIFIYAPRTKIATALLDELFERSLCAITTIFGDSTRIIHQHHYIRVCGHVRRS